MFIFSVRRNGAGSRGANANHNHGVTMLRRILDSLDGVDDSIKGLYVEKDGKFVLDLDGDVVDASEVDGLKKNHEKLLAEKKSLAEKIKEHEAAVAKAREEASKEAEEKFKKEGDIKGLTASYEAKLAEAVSAATKEKELYINEIRRLTVDATATQIASEIALPECTKTVARLLKDELQVKWEDGKASVAVVDGLGQATAYSLDEFKKNKLADKELARMLRGNNANGGGASGSGGDGVAPNAGKPKPTGDALKDMAARFQAKIDEHK